MAEAADVQSLFLQVDASVELLRRNLAAGEQPLGQFEQRAAKMAMSVEKSIGSMGKNFGPFAQMAQTAAQQAEKSFNDSFTSIQKMAAKAIQAPVVQGGGLNLGAADARQAAEAARQQAAALGLIEKAARAAAAGEGVMTQETRLYLQAASAARIEAERHAAELVREAGALERLEIETRAAASGQMVLVSGQRAVVTASAQQRQSTMMLGQQTQDFFVQVMSGQSVTTAFVQQIGQAAFAVQGMGGKMEKVGAFLMSGWGSAALVATTILIPLVAKVLEQNNALDDAVDKLGKEAKEAAITDKAHAIFSRTLEGQIALQRQLNDEMDRSVRTQRQDQQLTLYRNVASLRGLRASIPGQEAKVTDQQKLVDQYNAQIANPRRFGIEDDAMMGLVAVASKADQKLRDMRDKLADTRKSIINAEMSVREAKMPLIQSDIEGALDKRTAATNRYNEALGRLNRQFAIGAGNRGSMFLDDKTGTGYGPQVGGVGQAEFTRRAAALKKEYDSALKAIQSESSGTRSNKQVFADFQSELAKRGIHQAAGRTGYRSTADQREIFKSGESPLDGVNRVSRHQSWQALDPTRASHNDAAAQEAAQAAGLKGFRIVTESGGRKHYEWKGAGKRGDVDVAGSEAIERRTEAARQTVLSDQISFAEQSRQFRRRLLDAQGRSAGTEEERDRLAREEVEADYQARATKIGLQAEKGDLKPDEAKTLNKTNEDTRDQLLRNIQIDRARQTIASGFDDAAQDRQTKIAMLRINEDMATTAADRRAIQRELLELEQEERRQALEKIRQTSDDPAEVQRASNAIKSLPATEGAENAALAQRQAGPMEQYRNQLKLATGDMGTALEDVQVNGLQNVQNGLAGIISGTQTVGSAFKGMANSIIADLARIAAEKLIMSVIGNTGGGGILSVFGLSGGGKVEGKASGGKISGPGTGTSDSVLAMLGARPIMLSNGESIVTAEATAKFWPTIDAMNKGKVKTFAGGGLVGSLPSMPTAPRLPSMSRAAGVTTVREQVVLHVKKGEMFDVEVQRGAAPLAQAAAIGGANMALDEIAERNAQALT